MIDQVNTPIKRRRYVQIFYVGLFIAIGSVLRLWDLPYHSLRLDESQSIWQALHSIDYIAEYMSKNVHLPLHNVLLHFWMRIIGTDLTSIRLMAAIPGILSLPAIYLLAREILDRRSSLFVLFISSISPFWVWYSREIRMYSLLGLFTILSYYFFIKIDKGKRRVALYFLLFTIVNILGSYTHYFFSLVLGSQFIYTVINFIFNRSHRHKYHSTLNWLLYSYVLIGIAYAPWIKLLLDSTGIAKFGPELIPPVPTNIFLTFFEFMFGYQTKNFTSNVISAWPVIILMIFVFLVKRINPFKQYVYLTIIGVLLPMVVIYFASVFAKPMYLTRYLFIISPMFYIFIAWFLRELNKTYRYIFGGIFLVLCVAGLYNQLFDYWNPAQENYKGAVEYIEKTINPKSDTIVIAPAYTIYPYQYYYKGSAPYNSVPIWNKKKGAIPEATEDRIREDGTKLAEGHDRIFFLQTSNLSDSAEVKTFYDNNYKKLEKVQFSENIWVHVYQGY